jgi:hypothetical protein
MPNRQGVEVRVGVNRPSPQKSRSASIYRTHRTGNVLGIIPTEISGYLDLTFIRGECGDRSDALA